MPAPRSKIKSYVIYGGVGLSLCMEIAVAGLLGFWLGGLADKNWHMKPWGTTLGLMLFVSISFFHIMKVLKDLGDKFDKEDS